MNEKEYWKKIKKSYEQIDYDLIEESPSVFHVKDNEMSVECIWKIDTDFSRALKEKTGNKDDFFLELQVGPVGESSLSSERIFRALITNETSGETLLIDYKEEEPLRFYQQTFSFDKNGKSIIINDLSEEGKKNLPEYEKFVQFLVEEKLKQEKHTRLKLSTQGITFLPF